MTTTYPAAPWLMHGSMWVSAFRLGRTADERHPAGTYLAALVAYEEPSPLSYGELLVARVRDRSEQGVVTITDIWVDSPASRAGGRELWAIPKELCDFERETSYRGPLTTTSWIARLGRSPIVEASFTDVSRVAPRLPTKGTVWQPGIPDHPADAEVTMAGSSRMLPARSRWSFATDGPLGFLGGARKVASFRSLDFRLSFG